MAGQLALFNWSPLVGEEAAAAATSGAASGDSFGRSRAHSLRASLSLQ